jgi:hypothetical protein
MGVAGLRVTERPICSRRRGPAAGVDCDRAACAGVQCAQAGCGLSCPVALSELAGLL